jgi:hypothetical protein
MPGDMARRACLNDRRCSANPEGGGGYLWPDGSAAVPVQFHFQGDAGQTMAYLRELAADGWTDRLRKYQ